MKYPWEWFRRDLFAGMTVAAIAVPQGMAYAIIAGIDPKFGLYTAIVMTALGSLFGSSSHLMNGPTNAISLVVFSAVAGLDQQSSFPVAVFLLSILVGVIQILIALLKLGDLTRYVSESVILGFMAGAGLLVALSQVPPLLGLPSQGDQHQHFLLRLWLTLTQGGAAVSGLCVVTGVFTLLLVVVLRAVKKRMRIEWLPDHLISLLAVSMLVWAMGWKIPVVGKIPSELPGFTLPKLEHLDWVPRLTGSAFAIALLGLLEALAIAKSISARTRQRLNYNQQCLAEGLANLGGGFFQCMPGSGSLTRSAINYQAGAVTRLSGVFSALTVAATVLLFAPYAEYIPTSAIAGMLIITAWRLVDKPRTLYCLRASRFDAGLAGATAFAAVFLSIEYSIIIGTFLSFLLVIPRAARLRATEMVVSPERVVRDRLPTDPPCGRMVLYDLEGELFFGAGPELRASLDELAQRVKQGARVIVLRMKRTRHPDMVCMELLEHFIRSMQAEGVAVLLCGVREDFIGAMRNLRFEQWLSADRVFQEGAGPESSTLRAVRRAYELLGEEVCDTCPRRQGREPEKPDWFYMI